MQDNNQNLPNQTPTVVNPASTDDQSGGFPSLPEQPDSVPFETTPAPVSETPPVANGSDTPSKPSSPPRGNVLKLVATMFGLLLLAGGIIAGVTLTQQQQLINQKAGACPGASNCSTTCPDGTHFADQCPAGGAFASCSQWSNEACASHQSSSGGGTTGGTTSCKTSGAPCSTTCANGKTFSDPCPGGGSFTSCSQWATQACGTVGSAPTGGTTTTGECNPGVGLPYNGDIRCGAPYCPSSTQGQVCGNDHKWITDCVNAHACGYNAGDACNGNEPATRSCQDLGYDSSFTCNSNGTCVCTGANCGDKNGASFVGCSNVDPCLNCYSNGKCYKENTSCGIKPGCNGTAPTTGGSFTCYRCHSGAAFCESYTSSTACSTDCNACQPTTPPTTQTPTAQCTSVKAYDTNWTLLTTTQLSALKPGDKVRFAVTGTTTSGTFDKARFTINGTLRPEVSTKRPNSADFYDEYTIPAQTTTTIYTVTAQIHHATLNTWN